jgi:hypothetical protein
MVKASNEPLQPNPFTTYRDPKTGLWVVIKKIVISEYCSKVDEENNSFSDEKELLLANSTLSVGNLPALKTLI